MFVKSDQTLIRLENLRRLGFKARRLSEELGRSVQYWSELLRGKKAFGEKIARNIEEGLGLPRDSLDKVHNGHLEVPPRPVQPNKVDGYSETALELAREFDAIRDSEWRRLSFSFCQLFMTRNQMLLDILAQWLGEPPTNSDPPIRKLPPGQ